MSALSSLPLYKGVCIFSTIGTGLEITKSDAYILPYERHSIIATRLQISRPGPLSPVCWVPMISISTLLYSTYILQFEIRLPAFHHTSRTGTDGLGTLCYPARWQREKKVSPVGIIHSLVIVLQVLYCAPVKQCSLEWI